MSGGYVALLDVLGFTNLVAAGEGVERYLDCLKRALGATAVEYVVFSDNIVLTVEDQGADSLVEIAGACSRLMREMLTHDIPIRGAISAGEFIKSTIGKNVFIAGRAVVDAYRFEQAQNWIGVMITPTALVRVPDLEKRCLLDGCTNAYAFPPVERERLDWTSFIQRCRNIPFHASNPFEDTSFDGYAIVPTSGDLRPAALRDNIQSAIERLNWLRAIAPTPAAQRKYQYTTQWLGFIQNLWQQVVNSCNLAS